MALGGYRAGKSDLEHYIRERAREEIEIAEKPEVEAEEVRELLQSPGLTAEESAPVVEALRRRPEAWRDFMMRFELGLLRDLDLLPRALPDVVLRSEEHTSELQSQSNLVCRLLLEKKKTP